MEFAGSPETRKQLGEEVAQQLASQIKQINIALEQGGDANAEEMGRKMGEVTAPVISTIATGGGGSASQSMQMAKMGKVMSSKDLARVAATVKLSDVKERIAGIGKGGRDLDVPIVEPVATPGSAAAGAKATEQASLPSY
ncbi:hypothetical protein EGJ27_24600 [Pseudomonas sp. v388]|uniref:hypothetical protein n=1 Tax=Pseudomonas sp. v388 TaxID=2479849 RepID=UPI000F7A8175|nr:hypothetical protein [Pseudomonas sp. v388]RRV03625.1 hypothetical protein EGJ27_24600 [Pseudomonas sp. v388]